MSLIAFSKKKMLYLNKEALKKKTLKPEPDQATGYHFTGDSKV